MGSKAVGHMLEDFYGMLKNPSTHETFRKAKFITFSANSSFATRWLLVGLPESSGRRIRSFPCRYHFTVILHTHISPGGWTTGPLVAAVQRRSPTPSSRSSSMQILYL
jgi:hypothetical protein